MHGTALELPPACGHCGASGAEFICSRCRKARFCGPECQRGAWQRHRLECSSPAAEQAAAAPSQPSVPSALRLPPAGRLATVYPNVGAAQGGVDVWLPGHWDGIRDAIAKAVLNLPEGSPEAAALRLYAVATGRGGGEPPRELGSTEELFARAAAPGTRLVAAGVGAPLRVSHTARAAAAGTNSVDAALVAAAAVPRRYDDALVGGEVLRIAANDPELASLLRCSVPLVIVGSGLLGDAPELWSFEYLERHMSDVDNFYVLRAPASSRGRFAYYDLKPEKNPCGHTVTRTNERVEMRFPDFRREADVYRRLKRAGQPASSVYLQSAILHREEQDENPPKPVGSFGVRCAVQVAKDIEKFRWVWLREQMGGRHVQTCQLFCGLEADFSPCHYDPQDNMFAQVRGYKRALLFHPRHFASLYPWPVNHPQDRQSRLDFDAPDTKAFPRYSELMHEGLETVLGPGDVLHLPPGWWHHIEMLPSEPAGEVVSINFWYPSPKWFYGDPSLGDEALSWDRPLFGIKRVLFQRCVEELAAAIAGPRAALRVLQQLAEAASEAQGAAAGLAGGTRFEEALAACRTFVATVFPEAAEQWALLAELVDGRCSGLHQDF